MQGEVGQQCLCQRIYKVLLLIGRLILLTGAGNTAFILLQIFILTKLSLFNYDDSLCFLYIFCIIFIRYVVGKRGMDWSLI